MPVSIQLAGAGFVTFLLFYVGIAHESGVPLSEIWSVTVANLGH